MGLKEDAKKERYKVSKRNVQLWEAGALTGL